LQQQTSLASHLLEEWLKQVITMMLPDMEKQVKQ
jgi:hypothetical protein